MNTPRLLTIAFFIAFAQCATTHGAHIINGSFEVPQLTEYRVWQSGEIGLEGWTIETSFYDHVFQYLNSSGTGTAYDGNAFLSLSYTKISQPLTGLEIGTEYQLDFWTSPYTSFQYYGPSTITVTVGDSSLLYSYLGPYPGADTILPYGDPSHPWQQQSVTFTATAEQMPLSFTGGQFGDGGQFGNSIPGIDGITVQQVPEPSALLVLLFGGALCLRPRASLRR